MYDVNYFINKFEAIPETNIVERFYGDYQKGCAMGLCSNNGEEHSALYSLGIKHFERTLDVTPIITINNGKHPKYQQPTPKQRILAALYDIKKMQEPLYTDITAELASQVNVGDTADQPIKVLN